MGGGEPISGACGFNRLQRQALLVRGAIKSPGPGGGWGEFRSAPRLERKLVDDLERGKSDARCCNLSLSVSPAVETSEAVRHSRHRRSEPEGGSARQGVALCFVPVA